MIEVGRDQALRHGVKNVEYRHGDMEEIPIADGEVDLVFFSQSLHHALHPERALPTRIAFSSPAAASSSSTCPSTALKKPARCTPTSGSASAKPTSNPCSKSRLRQRANCCSRQGCGSSAVQTQSFAPNLGRVSPC
jgi:hypothetical protein